MENKYYHPELKWYTRLLPWFWFGNLDDPIPPASLLFKKSPGVYRFFAAFLPVGVALKLWWWIRNPFHNFCYYTIGLAGRDIKVYSKYPGELFAPMGFNWFVIRYHFLFLPGVSYWGKLYRWYIGWLDDGQFGIEFRRISP